VAKGKTLTLESSAVCGEKLSPIRRKQRAGSRVETLAASGRETELLCIALCIHGQECRASPPWPGTAAVKDVTAPYI